jgi:hypothetical protein
VVVSSRRRRSGIVGSDDQLHLWLLLLKMTVEVLLPKSNVGRGQLLGL